MVANPGKRITMENNNKVLTPALALAPILFLIVLLACSVYLFGADSSYGANQIALLFSAAAVALVGMYLGLSWKEVEQGILHGIQLCLGPWTLSWRNLSKNPVRFSMAESRNTFGLPSLCPLSRSVR